MQARQEPNEGRNAPEALLLSAYIEKIELNMIDLPRHADLDQQSLRALRMI